MLNDLKAKSAKPQDKDYKIFDEKGLYLLIKKSGSKLWRFKYLINDKEKLLAIGSYPEISLAEARERRSSARKQIANVLTLASLKKTLKTR